MPWLQVRHRHHCLPPAGLFDLQPSSSILQSKEKSGALSNSCLSPDSSPMVRNNALNGRQTYPSAFKFRFVMQTLKRNKQLICVGHVKANAVVADAEDRLIVTLYPGQ